MQVAAAITWYEDNVGIKLTEAFFSKLGRIGVIDDGTTLEDFNSLMLDYANGEPINNNGKYKIKANRIPLINAYSNEVDEMKPIPKKTPMFKIERMPNGTMRLVRNKN